MVVQKNKYKGAQITVNYVKEYQSYVRFSKSNFTVLYILPWNTGKNLHEECLGYKTVYWLRFNYILFVVLVYYAIICL